MISTSEIKSIIQKLQKQNEDKDLVNSKKKEGLNSRNLEKEIISSRCIDNIFPEDVNLFYSRINSNKMTEYTEYNNYEVGLLDVALSGASKFYLSSFPGSLENNERIMEWIRNIRYLISTFPSSLELASSITKLRQDYYGADTFNIKAPRLEPDEEGNIGLDKWKAMADKLKKGWLERDPAIVYIGKNAIKVGEGNHRLAVAKQIGLKEVPVRFMWRNEVQFIPASNVKR
jgi:hypothetical protein